MRSFKGYFTLAILILAFLGLTYELLSNPVGLITRILVGIGIVAVLFLIYRLITEKRRTYSSQYQHPTRAQLAKAKRTSSMNRKPSSLSAHKSKSTRNKPLNRALTRKDPPHLTVIEGKKNKKKSRALF